MNTHSQMIEIGQVLGSGLVAGSLAEAAFAADQFSGAHDTTGVKLAALAVGTMLLGFSFMKPPAQVLSASVEEPPYPELVMDSYWHEPLQMMIPMEPYPGPAEFYRQY